MKTAEQKRTIRKFKTEIKKFINKGISSGGICLKFEEKNINRALKDFFQKIILVKMVGIVFAKNVVILKQKRFYLSKEEKYARTKIL